MPSVVGRGNICNVEVKFWSDCILRMAFCVLVIVGVGWMLACLAESRDERAACLLF